MTKIQSLQRRLDKISAARKYKRSIESPNGCEVCGWHIPSKLLSDRNSGLDVHHIIPVAIGGTDDKENLIILCPNHHSTIHALWQMDSSIGYWGGPKTKPELVKTLKLIDSNPEAYYESIQLTDDDLFTEAEP